MEKFLIKLLVLSHIYNIYIWAGESWTFTSVDSNKMTNLHITLCQ